MPDDMEDMSDEQAFSSPITMWRLAPFTVLFLTQKSVFNLRTGTHLSAEAEDGRAEPQVLECLNRSAMGNAKATQPL